MIILEDFYDTINNITKKLNKLSALGRAYGNDTSYKKYADQITNPYIKDILKNGGTVRDCRSNSFDQRALRWVSDKLDTSHNYLNSKINAYGN